MNRIHPRRRFLSKIRPFLPYDGIEKTVVEDVCMDIFRYFQRSTGSVREVIPRHLVRTEEGISGTLDSLKRAFGEDIGGVHGPGMDGEYVEIPEGTHLCPPVECLQEALDEKCLTYGMVEDILAEGVDFIAMYGQLGGLRSDFADFGRRYGGFAEFIDLLLFMLELKNPRRRLLNRDRRHLDMAVLAADYEQTPEPTIATNAWEKRLRNTEGLSEEIATSVSECGIDQPYWLFSMASRCPAEDFWFLVFDEDGRVLPQESTTACECVALAPFNEEFDGRVIKEICMDNQIGMVGTPFLPCQNDDAPSLHMTSQRISVGWHHNVIQATIPSFYTRNHLNRHMQTDFYNLDHALNSKWRHMPKSSVRKLGDDSLPLSEDELKAVGRIARTVLRLHGGFTPREVHHCLAKVLSVYWPKGGNEGGFYSAFIRLFREPAPSSKDRAADDLPGRAELAKMIDSHIGDCDLAVQEQYKWMVFYRVYMEMTA